jgi:hypothetical protein
MVDAAELRAMWSDLMPDRVAVTVRAQTSLGSYGTGTATGADCWWRSQGGTQDAAVSDGVYTKSARRWYVPKSSYAGPPAVGDLLVAPASSIDTAATWTILAVDHAGAQGLWALDCISLQLAAGLRSTIDFASPDNTQDSAGRPRPTYATYATAVPARVQPQGMDPTEVFDAIHSQRRYVAFLGYFVDARAKHRCTDAGGNVYTVLGVRNPMRLDVLTEVDLELL